MIHDLFGGEILKTPRKKGWHFYNRIYGSHIDFTSLGFKICNIGKRYRDIPVSPDETKIYIDNADYSSFFLWFIRAFEENVGLQRYQPER